MISLIIPAYTSGPNIERTIESARSLCDEVVVVCTAPYISDVSALKKLGTVIELPWNYVFLHGFGPLYNAGTIGCKNDWQLLLGVAETVAEQTNDIHGLLKRSEPTDVYRCNHVNDPNTWKRIWNRSGGALWSGIIHEEIVTPGRVGDVIFRMQDTPKVPCEDPLRAEVFRFIKTLSYNHLYRQLLLHPGRLGGASRGWIDFVNGARESIMTFCDTHRDMLDACIEGDAGRFIRIVEERMCGGDRAGGVNFRPTGT